MENLPVVNPKRQSPQVDDPEERLESRKKQKENPAAHLCKQYEKETEVSVAHRRFSSP